MKRFVDIRSADTGYRFAWWDTVVDRFEEHSGSMAWDSVVDFAEDYRGQEFDRYLGLMPPWALGNNA